MGKNQQLLKNSRRVLTLKNGTMLNYPVRDPNPAPWMALIKLMKEYPSENPSKHQKYIKRVGISFKKAFFTQQFHNDPRSEDILNTISSKIKCKNMHDLSILFMQGKIKDELIFETLRSIITVNLSIPSIKESDLFLQTTKNPKQGTLNSQLYNKELPNGNDSIIEKSDQSISEAELDNITNIKVKRNENPADLQHLLLKDFVPVNDLKVEKTTDPDATTNQEPINLESLHDFLSNAQAKRKVIDFLEKKNMPDSKTFNWNNSRSLSTKHQFNFSDIFFSNTSKYDENRFKNTIGTIDNSENEYILFDISDNSEHALKPVDLVMMNLEKKDLFSVINGCSTKQPQHVLQIINTYILNETLKWQVFGIVSGDSNKIIFQRALPKKNISKSGKMKKVIKVTTLTLVLSFLGLGLYDSH